MKKIDPVAFRIGGLGIAWYGVLIALGVLCALVFATRIAEKDKDLYKDCTIDFALFGVPLGIIGARIYYVVFEWGYYKNDLKKIFALREGGLAIYGGIITGIIVAYIFCKKKKISFWSFLDSLAPGVVLAQSIGRWGNYINGEAHGGPTSLPWAIEVEGIKVHPTFLYESLWNFAIFIFLYTYLSKNKKFRGQVFVAYIILYGLGRFFIEAMRTDSLYIGSFRVSQLVSLAGIALGIILFFYLRKQEKLDKK
ncbi:prolipoprotein diacylglyceryl transferase [Clostridiales bacterium KA00134]|nr:prolipoprotein diacylglyceryl transferase [Clostridiales bacterium KA00134]